MAAPRRFKFAGGLPPSGHSRETRRARREKGVLMFILRENHPGLRRQSRPRRAVAWIFSA